MASFCAKRALTSLARTAISTTKCSKQTTADMSLMNTGRLKECQPKSSIFNGYSAAVPESGGLYPRLPSATAAGRIPREVAAVMSLLPLYSVTASSRLVSQLSKNVGAASANLHDLGSRKPR